MLRILEWTKLNRLGSLQVLNFNYFVAGFVPLIAGIASSTSAFFEHICFLLPSLSLPTRDSGLDCSNFFVLNVNWRLSLLFFGSLSIAVAKGIHDIFCPPEVSRFRRYDLYREHMLKTYAIEVQLHEHLADLSRPLVQSRFEDIAEGRAMQVEETARYIAEAFNNALTEVRKEESSVHIKNIDKTWAACNESYTAVRIVVACLFLFGAVLALILAGDAVMTVYNVSNFQF